MTTAHRGWPRRLLTSAALAAGLALTAPPLAHGDAGAPSAPGSPSAAGTPRPMVTHPQDDVPGSTIRRFELPTRPAVGRDGPVLGTDGASAPGLDVSAHQGDVNWGAAAAAGARFAYVKASEGTTYVNPNFRQQYDGSLNAGLIRGAYHFALPDQSNGVDQANYFVDHGGGWVAGGRTLPPALDIEYNPYGDRCYGLPPQVMSGWLRDFSRTVLARTHRYPMIYTSTTWWSLCTGNDAGFGRNPLWLPHYGPTVGQLPAGWNYQTIWQFADSGGFPGNQDTFNGTVQQLQQVARG